MKKICKLCGLNPSIENSHVVPEFMYKPVYDPKHRFVPLSTVDFEPPRIAQKGYKEPILCLQCEGKFSQWEGPLKKLLDNIYGKKNSIVEAENNEVIVLKRIDNKLLKIAVLSIAWRLIVAEGDSFKFYSATSDISEELRQILSSATHNLPDEKYPILVGIIERSDGVNGQDILMLFDDSGDYFGLPRLTFIAYGFLFDVVLGVRQIPGQIFVPNSTDRLVLKKTLIDDIMKNHSVIDITQAINKLPRKHYDL